MEHQKVTAMMAIDLSADSNHASTMRYIVPEEMSLHGYTDDHADLSFSANDTSAETLRALENCAVDIKLWMDSNRLKMRHRKELKKGFSDSLKVNSEDINLSEAIKYLWVYLDSQLSLKQHISYKCRMTMFNMHRNKNIRSSLTTQAAH